MSATTIQSTFQNAIQSTVSLAPELSASAARAARTMGQPLLLLTTGAAIAAVIQAGIPFGLASLGILLGALAYLFVMERAIPFRDAWQPSAGEWRRDGIYFGINGGVGTLVTVLVSVLAIHLARGTTGLALGVEVPLAWLVLSFMGYWAHRLGHALGALWQLHGVHHAPAKVNAWNNNVIHFLDLAFQNSMVLVPLMLLGFSPAAVFAVTAFSQVLGFVDHANADFRMGRLNYLIGTPEQHRLHHSVDLEEAGNYSSFPLWDIVFGTFTWRPGRVPAAIGIVEPESFPSPDSIRQNAVHPLRAWFRRG